MQKITHWTSNNRYPIKYQKQIQYLGITLTNSLKLNHHITKGINWVQYHLNTQYYLSRKNTHLAKHTRLHIYKTLIRSSLNYAATLLLNTEKTHKKKLDMLHRKAIWFCLHIPWTIPNKILAKLSNIEETWIEKHSPNHKKCIPEYNILHY